LRPSSIQQALRKGRRRRARAGFTLLELMVIVTIIMILAAVAAPGMMRAAAISRAQRATGDLARMARRARMESATYGRAYLLRFTTADDGTFELWRGLNDSCPLNRWADVFAGGTCTGTSGGPRNPDCVDTWYGTAYSSPAHRVEAVPGGGVQLICFEPDGDLYTGTAVATPGTMTIPNAAVRVAVLRYETGVSTTAAVDERAVLFPGLAAPRIER
jgi:type II secretory pathway pseudopilin PulG